MKTGSASDINFITYTFEDFPKLDEYWKEQVGLGSVSFYLTTDNEFLLAAVRNCKCCYGDLKSSYWILDNEGKIIRAETEEFYQETIINKQNIKSLLKFKIPERLTKNYIHFSIN